MPPRNDQNVMRRLGVLVPESKDFAILIDDLCRGRSRSYATEDAMIRPVHLETLNVSFAYRKRESILTASTAIG